MNGPASARYDKVATLFHWIIGIALLGQIGFGWLLDEFERGSPLKALAVNLHKSTGIVLGLLILARLYWRWRHRAPAYPISVAPRQARLIRAGHGLLYVCMIGLPVTGYLAANFSKHGVRFFNLVALPPWGPDDHAIYKVLNGAHDLLGATFTALVAGHVVLGLYHAYVVRDGLAARMGLGSN